MTDVYYEGAVAGAAANANAAGLVTAVIAPNATFAVYAQDDRTTPLQVRTLAGTTDVVVRSTAQGAVPDVIVMDPAGGFTHDWVSGAGENTFVWRRNSFDRARQLVEEARSAAQTAAATAGLEAVAVVEEKLAAGEFKGEDGAAGKDGANVIPTQELLDSVVPDYVNSRTFLGAQFAFKGDSISNYGEGYPYYTALLSQGAIKGALVQSHPGSNSTQILGTFSQLINATPRPTACILLWGANDAQQQTPLATFKSNTVQAVGRLREAGIAPILCTVPPNNNDITDGFVRLYNAWITRYASLQRIPLIDFYSLLINQTTGDWVQEYGIGDGLHPSNAGNKAMAQRVVDTLAPLLTPNPYVVQPFAGTPNLHPNSNFMVDTNNDGLADEMSATPSAGFAYTRVPDGRGFNWQRVTLTSAAAGDKSINGKELKAGTDFAVGDRMSFAARLRTAQTNQKTILQVTCFRPDYAAGPNGEGPVTANFILTADVAQGMTQPIDGLVAREYTVPPGTGIIIWQYQVQGAGTYDVAQPTWYNLTKIGAL